MLDWSIYWNYIYNDFIVTLFLIWCLPFFNFRLHNFKFNVSSLEFVWEEGLIAPFSKTPSPPLPNSQRCYAVACPHEMKKKIQSSNKNR